MTVGAVVADSETFEIEKGFYEYSYGAYMQGGYYKDRVMRSKLKPVQKHTDDILKDLAQFYKCNGCERVFAYNAPFDKRLLPCLPEDQWYDIMRVAAYKQHNPFLPPDEEYFGTGRLKKDYGAERIYRLLSKDQSYKEIHNAYCDACDELKIMQLLGLPMAAYDVAKI